MTVQNQVNIVTCYERTAQAWRCFVEQVIGIPAKWYKADDIRSLSNKELVRGSLWIIEIWNPGVHPVDPLGARTALLLAGWARMLLVFNIKPDLNFPDEGPFWITYSFTGDLITKIRFLLSQPPIGKVEYDLILDKYLILRRKPRADHHHA